MCIIYDLPRWSNSTNKSCKPVLILLQRYVSAVTSILVSLAVVFSVAKVKCFSFCATQPVVNIKHLNCSELGHLHFISSPFDERQFLRKIHFCIICLPLNYSHPSIHRRDSCSPFFYNVGQLKTTCRIKSVSSVVGCGDMFFNYVFLTLILLVHSFFDFLWSSLSANQTAKLQTKNF